MRLHAAATSNGDENLPEEFRQRLQFVLVVEPAENRDGNCTEREHGEFHRAAVNAVNDQSGGGNFDDAEFQQNRAGGERQENSRQHGEAAGERNRRASWILRWPGSSTSLPRTHHLRQSGSASNEVANAPRKAAMKKLNGKFK